MLGEQLHMSNPVKHDCFSFVDCVGVINSYNRSFEILFLYLTFHSPLVTGKLSLNTVDLASYVTYKLLSIKISRQYILLNIKNC